MSDAFEMVAREMAQLTEAIKGAKGDTATLDIDKLAAAVVKAQRDMTPVRKGEVTIGDGSEKELFVKGGKFDGKPVGDVLMTNYLLRKAQELDRSAKGPSKELNAAVEKALSATGAGAGDEYVPTAFAADLWKDLFLEARVANQFDNPAMPSDPWEYPLGWGQNTWRKGTSNTATTVSDPTTAKSTFTSTEIVTESNWSYDLDEDAVIAVLPTLREEITRGGADAIDNFVMNADSTATATGNVNLDDATPAADAYYLSNGQNGLRRLAISDNTGQTSDVNGALTDAKVLAVLGKLGKYATQPNELRLFCDPKTYISMLGMTNVVTMDKFGPNATVVTGALANYGGIPVIPTSAIGLTEADGKLSTTAGNNVKGQLLIAHRAMWKVPFKRQLTIELDRLIQKRQQILVASFRIAVGARGTRSTATHTAVGINITV